MSGRQEFRTFRDLDCWRAGRELRLFVAREILSVLPRDEKYRLGDQIIRAARSITANIAEGYGRYHYLDNAKFCSNGRGSAYEVLDHLITAHDEQMISDELTVRGEDLVEKSVRLLDGYIAISKTPQKEMPSEIQRPNTISYSLFGISWLERRRRGKSFDISNLQSPITSN